MKQLEKYCLVSRKKFYIISIIVIAIAEPIFTGILMVGDEDSDGIENPVIAAVIAAAFILISWLFIHHGMITKPRKRFKGRLKYFERNGLLNYAISDVQCGVTKFDGKVLLGKYCIMGKGSGLIVFYNEISSMYVKIDRHTDDDGTTTETWNLKIDAGGKTYQICSVKKDQQSIREWAEICNFIQLKAPNIYLK